MKHILILLSILLMCGVANAATETHYVCPAGSGAGDTDGSSWANCWDGFSDITWGDLKADDGLLGPDDDLLLRDDDGVYRERFSFSKSGSDGEPITVKADTGESPILLGSLSADQAASWTQEDATCWSSPVGQYDPGQVYFETDTDTVVPGDKKSTVTCACGVLVDKYDWCYDNTNDQILVYDVGEPSTEFSGIEVPCPINGAGNEGIVVIDGKSNLLIKDLAFKYGAAHAIKGKGGTNQNIEFDNIYIDYMGGQDVNLNGGGYGGGIQISGDMVDSINIHDCNINEVYDRCIGFEISTGLSGKTRTNLIAKSNYCINSGGGIKIHDFGNGANTIDNIQFINNRLIDIGRGGSGVASESGNGILIASANADAGVTELSATVLCSGNYVSGCVGSGIYLTGCGSNVTVNNNEVKDGEDAGIYVYNTDARTSAPLISGNLIYNNDGNGFKESTNDGVVKYYNNTQYNNGVGDSTQEIRFAGSATNSILKNNIILNSTREALYVDAAASVTIDYNCFSSGHATPWNYQGSTYATLALYQAASSQDAHSIDANPLFVDPANGDFRLKWGSPCINTGVNLGSDYDDALDPRDYSFPYDTLDQDNYGPWEIGAFVYRRRYHIGQRIKDTYMKMGLGLQAQEPLFCIIP